MAKTKLFLGPPGTGKTSVLVETFQNETVPSDAIAYVAYSKAAQVEALQRLGKGFAAGDLRDALPFVQTIHAMAMRLTGVGATQLLGPKQWIEFNARYGWGVSIGGKNTGSVDDDVRSEWELRDSTDGRMKNEAPEDRLALYGRDYLAFKKAVGLLDFTDVLRLALASGRRPEVRVGIVDEAQDLSPLQIKLAALWFRDCERVFIAGDDDQAIFTYQGATPQQLVAWSKQYPTTVLSQSYRLPRAVHAIAQATIMRNVNRAPKAYQPRDAPGSVDLCDLDCALAGLDQDRDTLLLGRTAYPLEKICATLIERGIPFSGRDRYAGPLDNESYVSAIEAALAIREGRKVSTAAVTSMLGYVPAAVDWVPPESRKAVKLLIDDEQRLQLNPTQTATLFPQFQHGLRNGELTAPMTKMPAEVRNYFETMLAGYTRLQRPSIRLSTIHRAKGQEADKIVLLSDMSRAAYESMRRDPESENRVGYVGLTRAKTDLVIVRPSRRESYDYPVGVGGRCR